MSEIIEHRPRPADQAWLDQVREEIIQPELPIVDPHHHLWQRATDTYLVPELVADLSSGHDIRATVFIECSYSYRNSGPEGMRPVGETDFAAGVAGSYAIGPARGCECNAGIVGFADLTLAGRGAVLRAMSKPRGPSPRHTPCQPMGTVRHHSSSTQIAATRLAPAG